MTDRTSDVERGLGGITVWLRGDSGTTYYYAHNHTSAVAPGQRVAACEVIAYVGNSSTEIIDAARIDAAKPLRVRSPLPPTTADGVCAGSIRLGRPSRALP